MSNLAPVEQSCGPSRWRPAPGVLHRRVGDESVLLHLGTGRYFELNVTGTRIWELVPGAATREELLAALAAEFDVEPIELATSVDELLGALRSCGLMATE